MLKNKKLLIVFLVIILAAYPLILIGSQSICITPNRISFSPPLTKQSSYSIITYDFNINSYKPFYSIPNRDKCHINGQFIDPTGSKIAISETCKFEYSKNKANESQNYYLLDILDLNSKTEIISLKHASYNFSFSPDGNSIVYLTSYLGESDGLNPPIGFESGIYIYNFTTKSQVNLDATKIQPEDINWSVHDNNIYIYNSYNKVFRYNMTTNKLELTRYKGIYFTPDGQYYSNMADEERISQIYRVSDNTEMTDWEKKIADSAKSTFTNLVFVSKKLNAFVFYFGMTSEGVTNIIFGTKQGKVIGKFEGLVTGTDPDGNLVQIHPLKNDHSPDYGKIEIIDLMKFKK